jgi:hypothetical protein
VQHEILEAPVTVYNFEVEGWHTYYVSDSAVLVHNTCRMGGANAAVGVVDKLTPQNIRFSQDSISSVFKDGSTVDDMIKGLKTGKINPNDVPAIRIFEKEGAIYSLDNRRLYAFREAGIDNIPYRWATKKEITNEAWKFTTTNGGTEIRVRGK